MAESKWSELKEVHLESKTKSCLPKRTNQMWKEHFKNLLGNSPEVNDKTITTIINSQQDIELGQFIQELNIVLTKIKSRKAAGLDEIPWEVWKIRKFDDQLLRFYNTVYKRNTVERWTSISPIPLKRWPRNHQKLQGHNSYLGSG